MKIISKSIYFIYFIYLLEIKLKTRFIPSFLVDEVDKVEVKNGLVDKVGRIDGRWHFFTGRKRAGFALQQIQPSQLEVNQWPESWHFKGLRIDRLIDRHFSSGIKTKATGIAKRMLNSIWLAFTPGSLPARFRKSWNSRFLGYYPSERLYIDRLIDRYTFRPDRFVLKKGL